MAVKRIRDESEYKSGGNSDFIGLDEGEKFIGHFLGLADPKIDDPAFFPYKMHWNGKTSVPCADEECIYCEGGEKPRSKAYTLWNVIEDESGKKLGKPAGSGELRIFDMPVTAIKQFNEMRSEGEKVQGVAFRISRPDEKTYVVAVKTALKPYSKTQVNELVKSDDAPDFEAMLNNKLKNAMEGTAVQRVLEDEAEDERPAKSGNKASKGKGKGKPEPEEEPEEEEEEATATEWPAEGLDEETVTVVKVEKNGQWIDVTSDSYEESIRVWTNDDIEFDLTDLSKDDEVSVTTGEKDDDGEYSLSAEPEPATATEQGGDDPDGNGLPDAIAGEEMIVGEIDAPSFTMEVSNDEMSFTLFFLDTVKIDFDDFEEGDKIIVNAEKDRAGDLVTTEVPEKADKPAAKKGGKGGKKAAPAKKKKGK